LSRTIKYNYRKSMLGRYTQHRLNAEKRNIPFRLSFKQWSAIWTASGKFHLCGNRRGRYCMARYGDQGAYEIGNVRICLIEVNRAERNRNYPMQGRNNPAFSQNYWLTVDQATRERHSNAIRAANSKPKSRNTRARMSATATGRRSTMREGRRIWAYPGDQDYAHATGWI
jgi:hypothetical protein